MFNHIREFNYSEFSDPNASESEETTNHSMGDKHLKEVLLSYQTTLCKIIQ